MWHQNAMKSMIEIFMPAKFRKFGGGRSGRTDASVTSEERPDNYEFGRFVYTGALDMFTNPKNPRVFDLVSALLRNVRNSSLLAVNVSDGLIGVVI